jgi:hypothetical protein
VSRRAQLALAVPRASGHGAASLRGLRRRWLTAWGFGLVARAYAENEVFCKAGPDPSRPLLGFRIGGQGPRRGPASSSTRLRMACCGACRRHRWAAQQEGTRLRTPSS